MNGVASQQWFWMLLSRKDSLVPIAPYLWRGLGGPAVDQQLWCLDAYIKHPESGALIPFEEKFGLDAECALLDTLSPLVRKFGFELQILNGRFFIGRKKAWDVQVVPWAAQKGKAMAPAAGAGAADWRALTLEISAVLSEPSFKKAFAGAQSLLPEGFWISGGGFNSPVLPYTQVRCAVASSPLFKGIAEACGINKNYILTPHGRWPDCPEGDRIYVFDSPVLEECSAEEIRAYWQKTVPLMEKLYAGCKGFEKYSLRLVATDGVRISTIEKLPRTEKESRGFLFFKKKEEPRDYSENWLFGIGLQDES